MESLTRLPGGVAIVTTLTVAIAALAFLGRRIEARRWRTAAATAATS
jgi:hypothetical protein